MAQSPWAGDKPNAGEFRQVAKLRLHEVAKAVAVASSLILPETKGQTSANTMTKKSQPKKTLADKRAAQRAKAKSRRASENNKKAGFQAKFRRKSTDASFRERPRTLLPGQVPELGRGQQAQKDKFRRRSIDLSFRERGTSQPLESLPHDISSKKTRRLSKPKKRRSLTSTASEVRAELDSRYRRASTDL
eukprot:SAG31_NODE_3271_length_4477_cov_2.348561_2_plen_190_part_00